jgi:succinylarginine dihydrolase
MTQEYNFDGLVGPTHNYGGLSFGNMASSQHGGSVSNPREAALQGLGKMRWAWEQGAGQALLPPQPRPSLTALRRLGFRGTPEEMITRASEEAEPLLRLCSSASSMWTANAATVAPSADTQDGKVHLTPANLQAMFHRSIEAETTESVLRAIFADPKHFTVHAPLPGGGQLGDEGAANHTRLEDAAGKGLHLFAWGRSAQLGLASSDRFPARQAREASEAVARLHTLSPEQCLFPQQTPEGIDAGAFHTDVLAVGSQRFLMLHALAFVDTQGFLKELQKRLGSEFTYVLADDAALPVADAVAAYPFNAQLLSLPNRKLVLVAPVESQENAACRAFLDRVVAEENPVERVQYFDLRQSMRNGGGPACLRLRVWLNDAERAAIGARVFFTPELETDLIAWVKRYYRDRLAPEDLRDPKLAREGLEALDSLTQILKLGSVYDFQC